MRPRGGLTLRAASFRDRLARRRRPPELVEAMRAIAATGIAQPDQVPSMGCSIKWKAVA
jgi:hypothetical protein